MASSDQYAYSMLLALCVAIVAALFAPRDPYGIAIVGLSAFVASLPAAHLLVTWWG
ncbi:MAG: hypothetical protein ABEJ82_07550 [Haloplanus sp.]